MACNHDSGCNSLANVKYPAKRTKLVGELNKISTDLDTILGEINGIAEIVPDDYVGQKVTEKIREGLLKDITNVQNDVEEEKTLIGNFIEQKIDEHQEHYREWKRKQEAEVEKPGEDEENARE